MEENFSSDNFLSTDEQPKRSQFFTTLCILSFIMCGLGLLSGVWNIYQSSPESMMTNIENLRQVNPEMADSMENNWIEMQSNPFYAIMPYLSMMYTLLSLLGVFMMWNLKKTGFYIYAIAEILPYTSFIFLGKNSLNMVATVEGDSSMIAMASMVIMVIIDVVFVALYGKNLNSMK